MLDIFQKQTAKLDRNTILEFNHFWNDSSLVNVIRGLNKECFGVFLLNAENITYQLLYVNSENDLEGFVLELDFKDTNRDNLVFFFSDFLSHNFKGLDTINTFNTFQQYTRSLLENLGYLTISTIEIQNSIDKYGDPNPVIVGAFIIMMIDKSRYYKDFFNNLYLGEILENEVCIYLMFNKENNYMKIGKSKRPKFREKTLQAQEPDIEIIASWLAPASVEKELHNTFKKKKLRGEWFCLNFSDLKIIKQRMLEYKNKENNG